MRQQQVTRSRRKNREQPEPDPRVQPPPAPVREAAEALLDEIDEVLSELT